MLVVEYGFYDYDGVWFSVWQRRGINNYSYDLANGNASGIIGRLYTENGIVEVPRKNYKAR